MQSAVEVIPNARPQRDVSFDYLRATLTLMVVAHHSALAYSPYAHFDPAHYLSGEPVVDSSQWLFMAYAENFNDVFFMSLMFFISGLFVWPSLRREGAGPFLRSRALRLGLPFAAFWVLVIPAAYYVPWQLAGHAPGYLAFWGQFLSTGGSPGPLWFIWVLLLFDVLAAGTFLALPRGRPLQQEARPLWSKRLPVVAAALMFLACAIVYLPALARFGFGRWTPFITAPFYFQTARLGLYLVWFSAGVWVGKADIARGFLARDGALARHWVRWVLRCLLFYNLLVFFPLLAAHYTAMTPLLRGAIEAVLWVLSCVASCFAFLALFRGKVFGRQRWMESLSRSAYTIYLIHYVFVVWVQWAILPIQMFAGVKFLVTFTTAAALSWGAAQMLLAIPPLKRVL